MIAQNMKLTKIYSISKGYNDFGIEIETDNFIKDIDCFIMLRVTNDKMIDVYSYILADYTAITKDKTIVKGNILKQDNIAFRVVEVFNLLMNTQLLLKAVE